MQLDTIGILLGLGAMLGIGLSSAFIKPANQRFGNKKTLVYQKFFTTLFSLLTLLFFLDTTTFDLKYIGIAFLIAFIGYIPFASLMKGIEIGKIGLVTPIANSSIIFTVLFSFLFFNEQLTTLQLVGIGIILLGIIVSSINIKDFKSSEIFNKSSGIVFALITCLGRGLVFSIFHIPVNHIGPILTNFITEFGIFILGILLHYKLLSTTVIKNDKKNKHIKYIILSALSLTTGMALYYIGISKYNSSIIYAITAINPLIILLYGKIIYKEKLTIQQYIGILIMIIGIVLLSSI